MESQELSLSLSPKTKMMLLNGEQGMSIESKQAVLQGLQIPPIYSNVQSQQETAQSKNEQGGSPSPVEEYFSQVGENVQISDQAAAMQTQATTTETAMNEGQQAPVAETQAAPPETPPATTGTQEQAMATYGRMQENGPAPEQPAQQPQGAMEPQQPAASQTTSTEENSSQFMTQTTGLNSGNSSGMINEPTAPTVDNQMMQSAYGGMSGTAGYSPVTAAAGNASQPGSFFSAMG